MYRVSLITGDFGRDGHEQSDTFYIDSNLSMDEIKEAYEKGVEIIGFDLVTDECAEYDDNEIDKENYKKLVDHGFKYSDIDEEEEEPELDFVNPEFFANMYLFFVKTGNTDFVFDMIDSDSTIDIGGYGLYY